MSQKSAEEDKAVSYAAPFQIRDASEKRLGDLKGGTCSFKLVFSLAKIPNWLLRVTDASRRFGKMLQNVAAAVLTNDVNCAKCVLP